MKKILLVALVLALPLTSYAMKSKHVRDIIARSMVAAEEARFRKEVFRLISELENCPERISFYLGSCIRSQEVDGMPVPLQDIFHVLTDTYAEELFTLSSAVVDPISSKGRRYKCLQDLLKKREQTCPSMAVSIFEDFDINPEDLTVVEDGAAELFTRTEVMDGRSIHVCRVQPDFVVIQMPLPHQGPNGSCSSHANAYSLFFGKHHHYALFLEEAWSFFADSSRRGRREALIANRLEMHGEWTMDSFKKINYGCYGALLPGTDIYRSCLDVSSCFPAAVQHLMGRLRRTSDETLSNINAQLDRFPYHENPRRRFLISERPESLYLEVVNHAIAGRLERLPNGMVVLLFGDTYCAPHENKISQYLPSFVQLKKAIAEF